MSVIIEIVEENNSITAIKKMNGEYTSLESVVADLVIAITKNTLETEVFKA